MSFDVDPKDMPKRILVYHHESDCYFICNSEAEFYSYCSFDGEIDDVTGVEYHEIEFKKRGGR